MTLGAAPARVTSYAGLDRERPAETELAAGKALEVKIGVRVMLLRLEMKK